MLPLDYRITTPVSDHFAEASTATRLAAYSDALELRDNGIDPPSGTPLLYHSEIDAASEWTGDQQARLREIVSTYEPELVSLHLLTRYQETTVNGGRFVGVGAPYDRDQLAEIVTRNVETVRELVGDVPILLENNNHLGTDAYDIVTDPSFLDTVVDRTTAGLLFDIAHAKITAHNTDRPIADYVGVLPLDQCRQVHLSRHDVGLARATDAHSFLTREDWAYFADRTRELPELQYVTLEYYADRSVLLAQLQRMQTGSSEAVIAPEPWDTEFFRVQVASITSDPTTPECLDYACVRCRETGVDCLYFETGNSDERAAAIERGFDHVDTKLIFERTLDGDRDTDPAETVRPVRELDRPRLREIAGSTYHDTRFYNDDRFDEVTCDELYATWIANACDDYADEVLVATAADRPVGFITCSVEDGTGEIGLVGVASQAQGQGLGTALLTAAIDWFNRHHADRVTVRTQAGNDSAIGLYRAAGFERTEKRYVLHRWFDG
jgi:uncharacterized protein (UPF0276 family)/ribosomal protein S18 acetylase RimI-like enzyme